MPKNILGDPPFEIFLVDTDDPISIDDVERALQDNQGISLCLRSAVGPEERGGYFFHIERADQLFIIRDFAKHAIDTIDATKLISFINHASGRRFDPKMLAYCQSVINFREDQIAAAEEA